MKYRFLALITGLVLLCQSAAYGTIFGNVRGIVHDPQHRPLVSAQVTIQARASAWSQSVESNSEGEFEFSVVPIGDYVVTVKATGFRPAEQPIIVSSDSAPILHFQLALETIMESVEVSATPQAINTESSTTQTTVSRGQILETPGADRTNSMTIITDYVPGAYMVHDQLHVRGGHQVAWEVDGVPVPNTNIASNVGPQFDPKDVDYIEMKTGGYSAEFGDRTYGVFNVVPRTGFEYNNEGELMASYGSFHQSNDQLSFGSHTNRFAYYVSLNANRSDLGLMTPVGAVLHDAESGVGGFGDIIFNATPSDQLRMVASIRGDHYQVPNTPEQQGVGMRDLDVEHDAFVNFSWVHTFSPGVLFNVSPFYHFNRANYIGGRGDIPIVPNDNRGSHYLGGQVALALVRGKHNAQIGTEAFAQHDDRVFALRATDGSGLSFEQRARPWGNLEGLFFQDQYRLTPWLSLTGGARLTHFSGLLDENSADPRLGGAIRLPKLGWVLRGYYGRYYQPPPLDTVSGPLLDFALKQGFGFLPLRGERDEQREFGLTIPFHEWALDVTNFRTHARNFFDHDVLGNSDIFLPLTIQAARVRGWEGTLRSPQLFHRARIHVAYSHQQAQGRGRVAGGLTDFSPPVAGYFLDHDQRNTVSSVFSFTLPKRAWATTTISYGSGFLDGDGPAHLPAHTSVEVSLGKSFGERWSLSVNALNAGNRRYLVDKSNTFGGTHYAYPREVYVQARYRFRF